jgi:hypothetical protein
LFIVLLSLAISVRAATLLDPFPEPSTTQFGYAIVSMVNVNEDGVPDLAPISRSQLHSKTATHTLSKGLAAGDVNLDVKD